MNGRTAPLVSIITPVLNRESRIRRSLVSVAAQSYPHIEHIVVDGGSTDGTLDVIRSFRGSSPIHWTTGPDEGMYDAINKGLDLARGDVLAYVNSDDLYFPWSVEVAVRSLRRDADVIYGDLAVLVEKRGRRRFRVQYYPRFDRKHYTYAGALGQPAVFWKRTVTDRIGPFDPSYKLIGDCEYWLRAARSGMRLRHVREVLAVQTEHGDTLRERFPDLLEQEWANLRSAYADWAGHPRAPWLEHLGISASWHVDQLRFIASARRSVPPAWPMFLGWLKERDVDVPMSGLFWSTLPGRLGRGHPLADVGALERAFNSIGNDTRSSL